MNNYILFILGNGRRGYLERTIASWEINLLDKPKYQFIFDDSGDKEYVEYLNKKFGDRYTIVPVGIRAMGQVYAINFIYKYLNSFDVDYIFELEEDWILFRPLKISSLINILKKNKNILQVRVPRTPASYEDVHYGSTLSRHVCHPGSIAKKFSYKGEVWYEWRGDLWFWSHNPSLYRKNITENKYPKSGIQDHEMQFGLNLLAQNENSVVAFYSSNLYDAYIDHIGEHNPKVLRNVNSFSLSNIPNVDFITLD